MWEEVKHYAKLFGGWLGVRGINMLAVAGAFATDGLKAGSTASLAPLVALPAGFAFATYVSASESNMRERRMTNAYRQEIATILGKHWRGVTTKDLETLAAGNRDEGIPPVEVFAEKLESERSKKFLYMMGHVAAAVVAGIAVWAGFTHFNETFQLVGGYMRDGLVNTVGVFSETAGQWLGEHMKPMVLPAMISAGVINMASDLTFTLAGERLLGLNKPTIYDRVQDIKRELRHGKSIGEEQVFELVLQANPTFSNSIVNRYHRPFNALPKRERQSIIDAYSNAYPLKQMVKEINDGTRSANELSFFVYGQASGTPLKEPKKDGAIPVKEKEKTQEHTPEMTPDIADIEVRGGSLYLRSYAPGKSVSASAHEGMMKPAQERTKSPGETFVEKLQQQAALQDNQIKI